MKLVKKDKIVNSISEFQKYLVEVNKKNEEKKNSDIDL